MPSIKIMIPLHVPLSLLLGILCYHACTQDNFKQKRMNMVSTQLIARGISDKKVLQAMKTVERHLFVPPDLAGRAYDDGPLGIGYGQTISQPYIVAFMTEILGLDSTDRVLEVGTGSGYQAAVLAEICQSVYTIEVIPQLATKAKNLLTVLGYDNIFVKIGDGYQGWPEFAPFDAIIVTCAPTHIPAPLQEQLKEGGRMIIPIGERYVQQLVLLEKKGGKIKQKNVLPVLFVPMVDENGKPY
jgi:protein-L-isoaspartate(D-aspartate) O-methyltransferase